MREDPNLPRPAEVEHLVGDASKARRVVGWQPTVAFDRLIPITVDADLDRVATDPHRQHVERLLWK